MDEREEEGKRFLFLKYFIRKEWSVSEFSGFGRRSKLFSRRGKVKGESETCSKREAKNRIYTEKSSRNKEEFEQIDERLQFQKDKSKACGEMKERATLITVIKFKNSNLLTNISITEK